MRLMESEANPELPKPVAPEKVIARVEEPTLPLPPPPPPVEEPPADDVVSSDENARAMEQHNKQRLQRLLREVKREKTGVLGTVNAQESAKIKDFFLQRTKDPNYLKILA